MSWRDLLCTINAFWTAAINHVWQATVFAAFITAVLLLFRRMPAVIRYILCLIASFKFLLSSALLVSLLAPLGVDLRSLFFDLVWLFRDPKWVFLQQQHQLFPMGEMQSSALPLFGILSWCAGAFLVFRNWFLRQRDFSAKVRSGRSLPGLEKRLCKLAADLHLRRIPGLSVCASISEPGVWGVRRAVIVLPQTMVDRLTKNELDAVLLHELTHVVRHDNLIAHLNMGVCALFWFHPLVWWLDRRMLAERELICDARVVEVTGATPDYRNGLLKVLTLGSGVPIAGVSCAGGGDLRQRIRTLMNAKVVRNCRPGSLGILLPVAAVILLVLALTLAAVPVLPCEGGIWFQYTVLNHS